MKRRTYIRNSALAAAGVSLLNTGFISRRAAISRDIGIQLYTMAKPLSDDFTGTIKKLAPEIMENVWRLKVPLKVNLDWGQNWAEAH